MKTETIIIQVRQGGGTYKTNTVRGLSASCTAGDRNAADALGRKLFGARFVSAVELRPGLRLDYDGRTHWRLEATPA
jgi:hypothetical protein